jgi:nucleoside-diphosphate-sugar epimerase
MGGSGQLGKYLISYINNLYLSKIKIYVFDNKYFRNNYSKNITFIRGNCSNLKDLNKLPHKIDIIFFLLGIKGGADSQKTDFIQKYLNFNSHTLYLFLNKIKNYKIKKIIFTSTEHVYGDYSKNFSYTFEKEPYPKNYYGVSKILSEKILHYFYKNQLNTSYDIFRIPRVIDYTGSNIISKIINHAIYKNEIILKSSKIKFNFIFINDLLKAFEKSMINHKKKFRILNIFNNSKPITLKMIAGKILNRLKIKKKITFYQNESLTEHNPIDLNISNKFSKKELKWEPLFNTNKIINELIKYYVTKKNIR